MQYIWSGSVMDFTIEYLKKFENSKIWIISTKATVARVRIVSLSWLIRLFFGIIFLFCVYVVVLCYSASKFVIFVNGSFFRGGNFDWVKKWVVYHCFYNWMLRIINEKYSIISKKNIGILQQKQCISAWITPKTIMIQRWLWIYNKWSIGWWQRTKTNWRRTNS